MNSPNPVPTYVAHIVKEEGGFRCFIVRERKLVHRGELRPDRQAARRDASRFVIRSPEDQRAICWADDYPVWRGLEQVGWVVLEAPLKKRNMGRFYPCPGAEPFRPLLEAALDLSRRLDEMQLRAEQYSDAEGAIDSALNETCEAITDLGLSVGTPPQLITDFYLVGDWELEFWLA